MSMYGKNCGDKIVINLQLKNQCCDSFRWAVKGQPYIHVSILPQAPSQPG